MNFGDREQLLTRLTTAEREIVFLVGAPLTAPAAPDGLGVPGVAEMVKRIRALFQDRPAALKGFDGVIKNAANPYQAAFQHVVMTHGGGQDAANRIIRTAVLEARPPIARPGGKLDDDTCERLERQFDDWSYPPGVAAIGRLAARHPAKFGGTVLTTNFDPLIELAVRRAGGRAHGCVFHSDGSLEQMRGEGCRVVHLHGYWFGTDSLHSPTQLGQDRPQLRASLRRLLRDRTIVVMAYGGWDDIFTRTLAEVTGDWGAYPDVLWCFYSSDQAQIAEQNAALFATLRPAIERGRAIVYAGIDCHAFLPALGAEVGGGYEDLSPVRDEAGFAGRASQREALLQAFDRGAPVQLLGPRQMGKSSLLRWMERYARLSGKPVAFVNAQGLVRQAPSDLLIAAAEALGKLAPVKRALFAESAVPDSVAAARALEQLAPACLLIDEADALAQDRHGFDKGFFDALRALGQAGKIQWISASERDLFDRFQLTGLTSAFLNDARKIHVGALSQAEAEEYLRARVEDAGLVELAYEIGGGLPAALGWLARQLVGWSGEREELARELGKWIKPLFAQWWQRLDAEEKALLKQAVGAGLEADRLSDGDRRRAQRLADSGFLVEDGGRLVLGGRAWVEFVRNVG